MFSSILVGQLNNPFFLIELYLGLMFSLQIKLLVSVLKMSSVL